MKRVYINSNSYLIISDNSATENDVRLPASIIYLEVNGTLLLFYKKANDRLIDSIQFSDIVDENGNAYSDIDSIVGLIELETSSTPKNFYLEVSKGNVSGQRIIHKFGSVVNVVADTTEDVWDAGGTYTFPTTTADMTHISQTADQVAARGSTWTIEGLNTSYVEVAQNVLLDASNTTTPVALATPLFRVNRMFMILSDITLTSTVRLHNTAETIDYTDIQTDHNQTLNAIYTVPSGKTAYLHIIAADYVPTALKNPDGVHFHLQVRRNLNSEPWRVVESFGVTPGNSIYNREFIGGVFIEEKSDIKISVKPEGKDAHAHASFELLLIDN